MNIRLSACVIASIALACSAERPTFDRVLSTGTDSSNSAGSIGIETSGQASTGVTTTSEGQSDRPEGDAGGIPGSETGSASDVPSRPTSDDAGSHGEDARSPCTTGFKECDGACIPDSQCCSDAECAPSGHCAAGVCECASDAHRCDDACISNDSPQGCGVGCEPCPVPIGGQAGCDGTKCTASCPADYKLCAGECIPAEEPCNANCTSEQHECDGVCVPLTSPVACGEQCEPCPAPTNAEASCDNNECTFECNDEHMRCPDDTCVSVNGCCEASDCSQGRVCEDNACVCADGTKECDGDCIPNSGCCIDEDCSGGLGCSDNQCVDVTSPQVVQVVPNDAATGVLSNSAIKITFSEPMDQASVQSALSITTLSSSAYTLAWNGDGSQLTITPTSSLTYAAVTSLSGAPRTYAVGVSAAAKDVSGNPLAPAFGSSFTTLRRVTQTLSPTNVGTGSTYGWFNQDDPPVECPTGSGDVSVGNHLSMAAGGDYLTWAAFDLSVVGQTSQISTLESAKFLATQTTQSGGFYPDGNVVLGRCTYGEMAQAFELPVSVNHGVLTSSSTSAATKDITSGFWTSWTNGEVQRLYRLEPDGDEPSNSRTFFSCSGFALELVFLAP